MTRTVRFRTCVLLLLTLTLLASPAFAGGRAPAPEMKERSVFAWVWHELGKLVPAIGKSTDGRSDLDPNGRAAMDPDGRIGMDPNG